MLLALMSLRATELKVSVATALSPPLDFGFTSDGKYSMPVHSSEISPLVFGLFTPRERDTFDASDINATGAFESFLPLAEIQSIFAGPSATLTGLISARAVYIVFLYTGSNSISGNAIISADFANGDSRLDYRAAPALIERPIALSLFAIVLIAWLANWFSHSNLRIDVHFFLTATFLSSILSPIRTT
jgi:hypothetical protein